MTLTDKTKVPVMVECKQNIIAVQDALEILNGKWRVATIVALTMREMLLFSDLKKELPGISAKVLTHELRIMEENNLVVRTVLPTKPQKVEYRLTSYGRTLEQVVFTLMDWGLAHRYKMTGRQMFPIANQEYIAELRINLPETKA